jgi:hypothetical protein
MATNPSRMGCLGRIGCLFLLLLLVPIAWITKDRWWPGARSEQAAAPAWEPLTPQGAARTRTALQRLGRPDGPVFASLTGGDVASFVFLDASRAVPGFADSAQAAVLGDQLAIRAMVPLRELGDLGPLGGMLNEREQVQLAGRMRIVAPGRGELTITDLRVRDLRLPAGLVPRLLDRARLDTLSNGGNAIPVRLPAHIGDVRVADGRITLYKNVP